jgi:hypothetical protein
MSLTETAKNFEPLLAPRNGCITCKYRAQSSDKEPCCDCNDTFNKFVPFGSKISRPINDQDSQAVTVKDPEIGTTDPTGKAANEPGAKLDAGKPKWYLLPWKVIEGVVKIMTFGAAKYTENGWKSVPQAKERYFSAMLRHKMLMDSGEYLDPESGLPHWAHFCCNAIFLGHFYRKEDDK